MKMRKKVSWLCLLLLVMLLQVTGLHVLANDQKVVDNANLLSSSEIDKLQEQFLAIAEAHDCDVALLTTPSCGTFDYQGYTKNYYLKSGYGYGSDHNGIILMITMKERKFQLTTTGRAEKIFTNYGLDVIDDKITDDLKDGDYYEAFKKYGELCEAFLIQAENGQPYDSNNKFHQPMGIGMRLLISLGAGLVVLLLVLLILYGQLKSVGVEKKAQEYVRPGSFQVKRQRDIFLYVTRTRRKIEKKSSSGGSGSSSGGHTGSF